MENMTAVIVLVGLLVASILVLRKFTSSEEVAKTDGVNDITPFVVEYVAQVEKTLKKKKSSNSKKKKEAASAKVKTGKKNAKPSVKAKPAKKTKAAKKPVKKTSSKK